MELFCRRLGIKSTTVSSIRPSRHHERLGAATFSVSCCVLDDYDRASLSTESSFK